MPVSTFRENGKLHARRLFLLVTLKIITSIRHSHYLHHRLKNYCTRTILLLRYLHQCCYSPSTHKHLCILTQTFGESIAVFCTRIINSIKSGRSLVPVTYSTIGAVIPNLSTSVTLNAPKIGSTNDPEGDLIEPASEELPVSPKLLRSNMSVKCTPSTRNKAILPPIR